jgi:hypothetical protein
LQNITFSAAGTCLQLAGTNANQIDVGEGVGHPPVDLGMSMAQDGWTEAGMVIDVAAAIRVEDIRPLGVGEDEVRLNSPIVAAHPARDVSFGLGSQDL